MHDNNRIHHQGHPVPIVAPQLIGTQRHRDAKESVGVYDDTGIPKPAPFFSKVERAVLMFTCAVVSVASLVFLYGAIKVAQLMIIIAEEMAKLPGVSN